MHDLLEIHQRGRVLRVALNRPEKRNALNAAMCMELVRVIEHAERDPAVGAIVLAGNGKCFCAGMDLSEIGHGIPPDINLAHEQLFTLGARLAKPLIGAVHGAALGGGTGLVANCHIVVAARKATFGLTGDPPGTLAVPGLPRRLGGARRAADHRTGADGPDLPRRRGARNRPGPRNCRRCG